MKNLLKTVLCSTFLLMSVFLSNAQMKVGWKGGLNLSTLSGYKEIAHKVGYVHDDYDVEYAPAFHFGITTQYEFNEVIFIQPELLFSMQGIKEKSKNETETSRLNFLQLPVYIGYKSNTGMNSEGIIGIGPYIGYGIWGSQGAYGKQGQFQHFDAGLTVMVGFQIKNFQLTTSYDFGMVDQIGIDKWNDIKKDYGLSGIYNRNFKVSFVWYHSSLFYSSK